MDIAGQILKRAQQRRTKIAIGILRLDLEIVTHLKQVQNDLVDLTVVGASIDGFNCVESTTVEATLMTLYQDGRVEGVVRGQADAFVFRDALARHFGYDLKDVLDMSILTDINGRTFMIGPTSQPQGWLKSQKVQAALGSVEVWKEFGIQTKIGLLTAVRTGSRGRNFFLDMSYEIADEAVQEIKEHGLDAKNYNIEIKTALDDGCNVIIPTNGVAGNQILRTANFLAKLPLHCHLILGVKENLIESFRNDKDFTHYIAFAAARANAKHG